MRFCSLVWNLYHSKAPLVWWEKCPRNKENVKEDEVQQKGSDSCSRLMHSSLRRVTKLSDLDGRRERPRRRRKTEKRDVRWPGSILPLPSPFPGGIARASQQRCTRVCMCVYVHAWIHQICNEMRGCRIVIIHREQWVQRHELWATNCRSISENLRNFVSYSTSSMSWGTGRGRGINPRYGTSLGIISRKIASPVAIRSTLLRHLLPLPFCSSFSLSGAWFLKKCLTLML